MDFIYFACEVCSLHSPFTCGTLRLDGIAILHTLLSSYTRDDCWYHQGCKYTHIWFIVLLQHIHTYFRGDLLLFWCHSKGTLDFSLATHKIMYMGEWLLIQSKLSTVFVIFVKFTSNHRRISHFRSCARKTPPNLVSVCVYVCWKYFQLELSDSCPLNSFVSIFSHMPALELFMLNAMHKKQKTRGKKAFFCWFPKICLLKCCFRFVRSAVYCIAEKEVNVWMLVHHYHRDPYNFCVLWIVLR